MGSDNEEETAGSFSQARSRKQLAAGRQQKAVLYDDFKAHTSMHGLWNIAAARGGIKKTFWLLVTLGAIIACIYQMATIVLQYYQYDVTVSKTFTFQRQTTFPAVTFCNMNPVKRSAISMNSQFSQLTSQKANSRRRRSDKQQQPIETRHEQQRPMKIATDDVMYESRALSLSRHKRVVYSCAMKATYDRNVFAISTLPRVTEYCVVNGSAGAITWSAASAVCSNLGYKLAVLDSQDEVAFIWSNQLWLINTLTPVKYWIGLKCTSAGLYNWYDGTAYSYNYWVSPAPSCSNQCAYGDGTNSTQWSVDSPSAAYSVLCYQDGYPSSPTYTCGNTSNFMDAEFDYEFCYIEGDSTTTWTQAQGICLSLNYSSLVVTDSIDKYNFIVSDDDKYFSSGTRYWIGLSVSTEANCTSHSYTWIDGSTSSWNVWSAGLIGYPACSLDVPTFGPYGCVHTHNDYSRDYQPADCQSTYAFICQRVTNSCNSNPCLNNGTCDNFVNGYTCTCTSSYTGVNCQTEMQLTTQAATTMPVTTMAQTTLSPTTLSVSTVPSTTPAKMTTLAATTDPLTTLTVSTEMATTLTESALPATSTVASTTIAQTTPEATNDAHLTTMAQTTPLTTVTSASVVVSTLAAHSLTSAESSTVDQPLTSMHSLSTSPCVQSTLPVTITKSTVQEEVSTVPQTNQETLESTVTFARTIMIATRSSITSTLRTTSSTTPPTLDGPSPTNAPLTGSSIPGRVALNEETQQAQQLTQILAGLPTSEKQQLGYQATDFLLDCQYAGYSCSPSDDFMPFYNPIHGNCYVFNSGWNSTVPRLNVSRVGSRYALKVTLNINQNEYITTGNEAAGARLVIHSQDAMPYPEDVGLLIKPGTLTSVHVSRTDYHRMAAPFGQCIDADTASVDMDVYTELYPVKYDHIGCYRTCFQRHMIHTCGCADSSLPNAGAALYNGSYPICNLTNMVQNDCNYNLTRQFVLNQLPCKCPLACDQIQYDTYVTQSLWPTKVDEKSILLALRPKIQSIFEQSVNDTTKFKRNLLRVEIYFDNLNLITITETAAYTLEEVLTNLSASLGAWAGVACMTFAEVFDLFMDYLVLTWYFIFCRNRARTDRKR